MKEEKNNDNIEIIKYSENSQNDYNYTPYYKKGSKQSYYNNKVKRYSSYNSKKYKNNNYPKGDEAYFNIALGSSDKLNEVNFNELTKEKSIDIFN